MHETRRTRSTRRDASARLARCCQILEVERLRESFWNYTAALHARVWLTRASDRNRRKMRFLRVLRVGRRARGGAANRTMNYAARNSRRRLSDGYVAGALHAQV